MILKILSKTIRIIIIIIITNGSFFDSVNVTFGICFTFPSNNNNYNNNNLYPELDDFTNFMNVRKAVEAVGREMNRAAD